MRRVAAIMIALALLPAGATAQDPKPLPPVATFAPLPGAAQCKGADGYAAAAGGARLFLWRPEWLTAQRAMIAADGARAARLRRAAEAALKRGPYSVRDKPRPAVGGDAGDYLSIGPYWWPDPAKLDGLPYVRRDGEVNPERNGDRFDATRASRMSGDVTLLTLAAHHLGERRYADHAARLVRAWFIDPATRMNPNLDYAQAVPGRSPGRAEGIIDAARLTHVVEAIGLLRAGGALTADDDLALRKWFGGLARWMAVSENGKAERAAKNNHGIYYDMLLAHFALYAGMDSVAQRVVADFPARRIVPQMDAQGRLPLELARTRGWHYSVFALDAAMRLAMLGECVGLDLWRWQGADGRSLRLALTTLDQFRKAPDKWVAKDQDLDDPGRRETLFKDTDRLFRLAAWGYRDATLNGARPADPTDYTMTDFRP